MINMKSKGFSLIETFVAITILLVAVIGPLGLISRSIQDGGLAKNKVIAYYLAQGEVERMASEFIQTGFIDDSCSFEPPLDYFSCEVSSNNTFPIYDVGGQQIGEGLNIQVDINWTQSRFVPQEVSTKHVVYNIIESDPGEDPGFED